MTTTNYSEYHPSSGWIPAGTATTTANPLSPGSWSDPESRQESPGSIGGGFNNNNSSNNNVSTQSPIPQKQYNKGQPPPGYSSYASPQSQRPVVFPAGGVTTPQQQHPQGGSGHQLSSQAGAFYPQQDLTVSSPHAVYDEHNNPYNNNYTSTPGATTSPNANTNNNSATTPSATPIAFDVLPPRDEGSMWGGSGMDTSYSSWIEQQHQLSPGGGDPGMDQSHQSHASLMGSPLPNRNNIWSSAEKDNSNRRNLVKSPVGPPTVYQPPNNNSSDGEDPMIAGMNRLSLLSAKNTSLMSASAPNHHHSQSNYHNRTSNYRGKRHSTTTSSLSSGGGNDEIPGLVPSMSASTSSLPTVPSYRRQQEQQQGQTDAMSADILSHSLRSFLDDDGGDHDDYLNASPTSDRPIIPGPPGFMDSSAPARLGVRQFPLWTGQASQNNTNLSNSSGNNYGNGNYNTRRNRQRNRARQQKKADQQRNLNQPQQQHSRSRRASTGALKERNNSNDGLPSLTSYPLEPVMEKTMDNSSNNNHSSRNKDSDESFKTPVSSLKRAVAREQQDGRRDRTSVDEDTSEADNFHLLRSPGAGGGGMDESAQSITIGGASLRGSIRDLEASFLGASTHSLRMSPIPGPSEPPILPQQMPAPPSCMDMSFSQIQGPMGMHGDSSDEEDDEDVILHHMRLQDDTADVDLNDGSPNSLGKKREWLIRMNKKLQEIPVGDLDPSAIPINAIMNTWAKTKSAQGAEMCEQWLKRAQEEYNAGNTKIVPTAKMYTMAVDAWARSGERGAAANRAESLLHNMNSLYQAGGNDKLKPTTGIFNAVINAWARSREKMAAVRAEQILNWMENFKDLDIQPDKYTYNTVIHAFAKAGGTDAALKAQQLLSKMDQKYQEGSVQAKPDTITYNVVINALAKSGGQSAAMEAEKLLAKMHRLHEMGDKDVKPSVVTYGAVIDAYAKSQTKGSAARADALLAHMIQLHQNDPIKNSDMLPNTYVFNTVINCWAKSKEHDSALKAEEMLVAMSRLHQSGIPNLKPDAFTYTAVIDAYAKSCVRGAAQRADQLLDKMEAKYLAGDNDLKPNTFTYNAVINALAKSGEVGAAARAERVLQNMVNRYRSGGNEDVKPTTINFNTVLDAWAKSGAGKSAARRAEEILEWMDRLYKGGNPDVKPDTITFNAVLDAWARSGDKMAPYRAEQILDHMDELYRAGNRGVKPDTYTYNTLINAWAKLGSGGSEGALRAERVLSIMQKRYRDGDNDFKPNTRTHTSVIDAWAKSGAKGAAKRAEQILNNMISHYEATGDSDVKPNVHTANAVCNACAFTKMDEDRAEAMQIAFRVFDWLSSQPDMSPDSYTYTILLSVCANLIPKEDSHTRYMHARAFFDSCREAGHVNDYVLRKLRQTVTEDEYLALVDYRMDSAASSMPASWTRNAKINNHGKGRKGGNWSNRRRGK